MLLAYRCTAGVHTDALLYCCSGLVGGWWLGGRGARGWVERVVYSSWVYFPACGRWPCYFDYLYVRHYFQYKTPHATFTAVLLFGSWADGLVWVGATFNVGVVGMSSSLLIWPCYLVFNTTDSSNFFASATPAWAGINQEYN